MGHCKLKPGQKCRCSNKKKRGVKHKIAKHKRKRNYKEEYATFHGKPKQIKLRAMRNQARHKLGLKVGDSREVDHIVPLSKNGTNNRKNLKVVSRTKNRRKGNKMY